MASAETSTGVPATETVGWDTSLLAAERSLAAETVIETGKVSGATPSNSSSDGVPKLRPGTVDYSKFDKLVDDDEDDQQTEKTVENGKKDSKDKENSKKPCRNCDKADARLTCSVCKKAAYCNQQCQRKDWQFHKRICKKPEPPKEDSGDKKGKSGGDTKPVGPSGTKNESSTKSSSKDSSSSHKPNAGKKNVEKIEEISLAGVKGYTEEGLPYFHRELTEEEKKLIGDTAPKKIESSPAISTAESQPRSGSAWNAGGTWEEKNVTPWAKEHIEQALRAIEVPLEGSSSSSTLSVEEVDKFDGQAHVAFIRGTKRYIFDFSFVCKWKTKMSGKTYKGKVSFQDVDNDFDYEASRTFSARPNTAEDDALLAAALGKEGLEGRVLQIMKAFAEEMKEKY